MQKKIVDLLLDLNRRFYSQFAEVFSASRARTEPGLERILDGIRPRERVLDLGCGSGRVALLLPPGALYVGVDYAQEVLDLAEEASQAATATTKFIQADLLTDPWIERIAGTFDWVILRAVLHHIPGYENRLSILRRAALVTAPKGHILLANWQFLRIKRLRKRVLPWETIDLGAEDVEPGDYLLDWRRQGRGLRYVHLVDEEETSRLIADADLHLEEMYYADGHTNDLTLYALINQS
jgi:SAM-dependent methyltransferase